MFLSRLKKQDKMFVLKLSLIFTLFFAFSICNTASALIIEDYDDIDLSAYALLDEYSNTSAFISGSSQSGGLTVNVYYNDITDIFLYELYINPVSTTNISLVTVPVSEGNYDDSSSLMAGYSSSDAGTITFNISWDEYSKNINYTLTDGSWGDGDSPITFYFESLYAPGIDYDYYFITNGVIKYSLNYAPDADAVWPVPEPGCILLLLTGLIGCTGLRYKSFRQLRRK